MTNKLNNLSTLVPYQLPEFIREDHRGIVAFIEAYYEWLDAETDYLRSPMRLGEIVDVDKTMDIFLSRFKKQYLLDFPETLAFNKKTGKPLDEKILIKNIKDFYRAKGTEKTYKFLFRILYDTDVTLYYPKTDILKLSDGKWIKKKYIKVLHTSAKNIFESVGKTIVQRNLSGEIIASGSILDVNSISTHQTNIHQVSQIYFTSTNGTFLSGYDYPIEFTNNSGSLIKEPRVFSCVQSVTILKGGSGYLVGDAVEFSVGTEIGRASGRVFKINSRTGAIEKIKIENSGLGYDIAPTVTVFTSNGVGFEGTVSVGAIVEEQGYYSNNDGRLSTNKVMQDNHYFQEFSYVLETDAVLKKYKESVLRLLHPIGTAFFNKASIQRCVTGTIDKQTDIGKYEIPYITHYSCYSFNTFDNLYDWFQSEEISIDGDGLARFTGNTVPIRYYPTVHDEQLIQGKQNPITNFVGIRVAAGVEFGADVLPAGTQIFSEIYNSSNPSIRFATTTVAANADDISVTGAAQGYSGDGVYIGDGAQMDIIGGGAATLFVVYAHPNTRLTTPQLIRIPIGLKSQFLGSEGATGSEGYWHEWTRGVTAQRQEWVAGFTEGSQNAFVQFDKNTEFKKINIGGFLGIPQGSEFSCRDAPQKDFVPKVIINKINEQTPPANLKDAAGVYAVFGETSSDGLGGISTIFERREYTVSWTGLTGGSGALKYYVFRDGDYTPIASLNTGVTTYTDKNSDPTKLHQYTVKAGIDTNPAGLIAINTALTTTIVGDLRVKLELQNTENIDLFSIPCHTGLKADLFMYRKDTNKAILVASVSGLEALIPSFRITYNQNSRIQKNNPRSILVNGELLQSRDTLLLRAYYTNKEGLPITGSESEVYFQYSPLTLAPDDVVEEDAVHFFPNAIPLTIGGITAPDTLDNRDAVGDIRPLIRGIAGTDTFNVVYSQSNTGSFDYFNIPDNGLRAVVYSYDHDRGTDFNLYYRALWTSPPLSVTETTFQVDLTGKGSTIDGGDKNDPYYTPQKPLILIFQYVNTNGTPIGENRGYDWLDEYGQAPGTTFTIPEVEGVTASNYRKLLYPRPWHLFNFLFNADS